MIHPDLVLEVKMHKAKFFIGMAACAALFVSSVTVLADSVISPVNTGTWGFDTRDADGNVLSTGTTANTGFVNGPATPPAGTGSAHLVANSTIANADGGGAAELRSTGYNGVALSSITQLSYSTYMADNLPAGQQFPYLRLWVSFDGVNYDDSLFFEPPYQTPAAGGPGVVDQGATQMNTWQTWDALNGAWWDNNGDIGTGGYNEVGTLAQYLTLHPTATIINISPTLGGIGFAVGFADPGSNYDGNVDNFTIGIAGSATTYDFENAAAAPLPSPAWTGLAVLGIVAGANRLKRSKRELA